MAIFGLNSAEIQSGYDEAATRPFDPARDDGPGFFEGAGTALPTGFARAGAEAALPFADEEQRGRLLASQKLDPATNGWLAQALYGLGSAFTPAVLGTVAAGGNPVGGALALGETKGYAKMQELRAEGVDEATAAAAGTIEGLAQGVGVIAPAAAGTRLATKVASGAGINVGLGMGQRAATGKILADNGYADMAKQYEAIDGMAILTDAVLGSFFGALHAKDAAKEPLPSEVDAALAANNTHNLEIDSAPGIPADAATRNAHIAAADRATEQLLAGERVDVANELPGFLPMDRESRLGRAREQGFDVEATWYHGTTDDFDAFDLDNAGTRAGRRDERAVFLTPDPDVASTFATLARDHRRERTGEFQPADAPGPSVMPVVVSSEGRKVVEVGGRYSNFDVGREIAAAREEGYRSVLFRDVQDMGARADQLAILDPAAIRSIHADFHPEDAGKPFLVRDPARAMRLLPRAENAESRAAVEEAMREHGLQDVMTPEQAAETLAPRPPEPTAADAIAAKVAGMTEEQRSLRGEMLDRKMEAGIITPKEIVERDALATPRESGERQQPADPEIAAAQAIAAERPDLDVTLDDGTTTKAGDALKRADEELAQAEQDAGLFEAAINCYLRYGDA